LDPSDAFCLNLHADYLCRHEGACCTAGWAIPVEEPVYQRLHVHFGGTRERLFASGGPPPDGAVAVLGVQPGGACVFFEADRGNLCAVHSELGAASLPSACRQFPRVVVHSARGTLVSLSHFCPTAAGLLQSLGGTAFEIVPAPDTLTLDGEAEGLDARDALPPLLRPGMLTDHEGYDAWERRGIDLLGRGDLTAEQALALLEAATTAIQTWRPVGASLRETVHREFDVASARKPDEDLMAPGGIPGEMDARRARLALSSIPLGLPRPPLVADYRARRPDVSGAQVPGWPDGIDRAVRGYLAARLFGNWVAYYGQGLHAIVEYLQVALALVKMHFVEMEVLRVGTARDHARESPSSPWQNAKRALRSADLLLVHLADPKTLSSLLGQRRQG
jgi:Fe-S-cluster containining protein